MPRPSRGDVFRIEVEGAGPTAAAFTRIERRVQDAIIHEFRRIAPQIEAHFVEAAPEDLGQLRDDIRAVVSFNDASAPRVSVRVEPSPADPASGYHYLRVTRYGHRRAVITVRNAKAMTVYPAGRRNPHILLFRRSVAGARPDTDWVADGRRAATPLINGAQRRIGHAISRSILR